MARQDPRPVRIFSTPVSLLPRPPPQQQFEALPPPTVAVQQPPPASPPGHRPSPEPILPDVARAEERFEGVDPTLVHVVPNWEWDRTRNPLPPDGRLWKDAEKTVPNQQHNEGNFDPEYFEQELRRQAVLNADLYYTFVVMVAGLVGQGTTADAYWRASEAGGRAVEAIFANLDLSRAGIEGVTGGARSAVELEARKVFSGVNERDADYNRIAKAFPGDEGRRIAAATIASSQLKVLSDIKGLQLDKAFLDAVGASSASGRPGGVGGASVVPAPTISAADAEEYFRKIPRGSTVDEYQKAQLASINSDPAFAQVDLSTAADQISAAQANAQRSVAKTNALKRLTDEVERLKRTESIVSRPVASSAADPPPVPSSAQPAPALAAASSGPNVRLADGSYLDDVNDPNIMLLRLMFRPGRSITESELRAWDALYYGGSYFASVRSRGASNDPKSVRERIELARTLDRMLRTSDPGVGWRRTPENVGMLFVTPQFRSALLMARERVRNVCGKPKVALIDLMTHERVYVYFAKLVSFEIAEVTSGSLGRFPSVSLIRQNREDQQRLLALFKTLEYAADKFLCFAQTYSPAQDAERRAIEAHRRGYLKATGRYFADRYDDVDDDAALVKRPKLGKKPQYGIVEAQKRAANRAALLGLL